MRIWRNWQTRRFQVPVGDRAGSTPVIRTKKQRSKYMLLCFLILADYTGAEGRQASYACAGRRFRPTT